MGVNHGFNQPTPQKLASEMGLYLQKHCQLGPNETEKMGQNEGRLLTCVIIQEKGRLTSKAIQRSSGLPLPSHRLRGKTASP